jgi:hypothetical protein
MKRHKRLYATIISALGKINGLPAALAFVLFFEFIGENFHFLIARGTLAYKRFEIFELKKTGAVLGCCRHAIPPSGYGLK